MKYLFILGRNIELSLAEISSFLEREEYKVKDFKEKENSVFIDLDEKIKAKTIERLGGVIAIGEVSCRIEDLDQEMVYRGEKNNFSYALWDFSSRYEEVCDYLKQRFRLEKLKASQKQFSGRIKMQNDSETEFLESKVHEEYFVFENYFGRIIQKPDYKEIEKRDMEKPVRRPELSVSPRLAKIMINLSEINKNEKLVDCFCGVGIILQEALLQDLDVVGVDRDKKATENAKINLKWFNFNPKNYKIINFDSRRVNVPKVEVMVSEPDLGEIHKKIPTREKAEEQLEKFEDLIISVLKNMKNHVSRKFVFSAPYIRIGKERVGCNFEKILQKTGLKLKDGFPVPEFREGKIVGREIFVLEY